MARADLAIAYASNTVAWAKDDLELTLQEVAQTVGADRKTVARWLERESVPSPEHRRQLERLNQLKHLLGASFRSVDAIQAWMQRPAPGLKGQTPWFVLTEGGLEDVLKLLGSVAAGAFR
jgi:uncharacterized protein (DUF2384 family)